jgi:hypothetical protein
MNSDEAESLIACLESTRKRPAMYFGKVEVEAAVQFLNGFQVAVGAMCGFDRGRALREQVLRGRGWPWSAAHPFHEMLRRGMTPEAVIDELLVIEIEVVRRQCEQPGRTRKWPLMSRHGVSLSKIFVFV